MERRLFLSILLICGLLFPAFNYAGTESFLLSEKDTKFIVNEVQKEVSRVGGTIDIFKYSSQEQAALTLLRGSARDIVLRFLPAFAATETVKVVLRLVSSLDKVSKITIKGILDEIEKQTVGKAVEIGNTWLLQNEVKTGSGTIEHQKSGGNFQYLLIYKSTTESRADIIFEFYSPDQVDSPSFRGSMGTFSGSLGDSAYIGKVNPFVIHIETKVEKIGLGWAVDSSADTKITVEFPEKVPVLKLAKELPYPLEEQKIKLLNYWTTAKKVLEFLRSMGGEALGKAADLAYKAQETTKGFIVYLSQLVGKGGALLIDPFSQESQQIAFIESQLNQVKNALDSQENEVKLNLVQDEAKSAENLIELSFPQEQQVSDPVEQVELDSVKENEAELNPTKDVILVPNKEEVKLDLVKEGEAELNSIKDTIKDIAEEKPIAWCAIDSARGPALSSVFLYEIAWMGSVNSANDEWMKLKNVSNSDVNIAGWQLQDADNQIQIVFGKEHSISSQSTFVLERTNDDSLPDTTAHVIYTGALNNTNEALYLFDERCVLRDKVVADPDWLAGDSTSRKPMERGNDLSWHTLGSVVNSSPSPVNLIGGGGGGGGSPPPPPPPPVVVYSKILISEIQIAGDTTKDEFVELYNPTGETVNLTGWSLKRKTSTGSDANLVSSSAFSGTIGAYGYFLIVPQLNDDGTPNYKGSATPDLFYSGKTYSVASDNVVFLYSPNGELSDKVGFGAATEAEGSAAPNPPAGQSLNRIWDTTNQTYYDRDNNSLDFTVHNPTSPKAKNIENAPPPPADTTAPAAVVDLLASNPTTFSIQLAWTAPGDDDSTGIAASYDVRYGTDAITGGNFNSATQVTGEPTPSAAGSDESMTVSGLSPETTYFFALKASDEILNVSELSNVASFVTAVAPPPPQDTTVPEVTFGSLSSSQSNTFFSLSWTVIDPVGDVSPSGLQSIFLEYTIVPSATGVFVRYDDNEIWTDWQAGSTGKLTLNPQITSINLRAQDGVSYTFQVSANDVVGNISTVVSASTSVTLPKTVIINEVAWGGTKAQSTDEWLELFNTTDSSVDLTGWKVVSSDSGGPDITLAGTIAAGGFYLIERTDDLATTATAQLTASFGNGLSNTTCETLSLYNAETAVVDETACTSDGAWPAGIASPDYISMERIAAATVGSSASNWADNNRIQYNSKDVGNNWINGTPGTTNSTATSPTTVTDTTLRFDEFSTIALTTLGSPYVTTVSITIPTGKTLLVEPGVTVKFKDNTARLTVQGTLKAQGTQASGITLTVTDGGAIWCGIKVASTSTASQLDYVTVDKAQSTGSSFCNESINYAMYVDSSAVTINNSVIQTGSYHRKLYLKNSNSTINAVTVSGATLNAESVGIYIDGGSPTISSSTISNNSIGIFVNSLATSPTIQNNTFTGNTYAVKLSSAGALLSGNTASGNTYNGVFVEGATQANTIWQKDGMPYIVNKFTVSAGTTLTIQAGAVVKFINSPYTDSAITVNGALVTQGTETNPVVFTAAGDNTVGGSNSYTGGGIKTSWERIYIAPGSTGSQLTYTTLKYGGNAYNEAALYVKQSDVQLSNVTISNSAYSGIYSSSGTITGSDVTLSGNTYGFHIQTGDCPALTNVTVTGGTVLHPSSLPCSF